LQIGAASCGLIGLAVLAVAVRVAAVFAVGSYKLEHVTYEHGEIARNLLQGRGFSVRWLGAEGPTSQQAPVYPALLAVFYWPFGIETPAALMSLELFQALLGGLLAVGVLLLAWELLPDRPLVGWLAGLGSACYPTLVYATTQVQVASLATLLVVGVLYAAARATRTGSNILAVGCGLVGGLLVLTDPILALVVITSLWMLLIHPAPSARLGWLGPSPRRPSAKSSGSAEGRGVADSAPASRPLALSVAALLACVAVVSPWIMRNYFVHGELVPVKSTFGYAFWQGNHPRSFGTDKIPAAKACAEARPAGVGLHGVEQELWRARLIDTLYIDDAVLSNERIAELGRLSEPQRSRQLLAEAVTYIREHPWHYARLSGQRLRYFLLFDETNPKSRVRAYRISHLALLVLCAAGLWVSRDRARRLWPTYLVFGSITIFHSLTIVSARFHIPLEPMQIVWAACAAAPWAKRLAGLARRIALCWTTHHSLLNTHCSSALACAADRG
jgi:hypothetical protein